MNILYPFGYKKRIEKVIRIIEKYQPKSILELCFGDVIIADHCKKNDVEWQGIDINMGYVNLAKSKGFNVICADLKTITKIPTADICVIAGSLYHFNTDIHSLFSKILAACNTVIISEPIKNWSDKNNWIGNIARLAANAGNGNEEFRYNETTLNQTLEKESIQLNFSFKIVDTYKKDCIVVIKKNGSN